MAVVLEDVRLVTKMNMFFQCDDCSAHYYRAIHVIWHAKMDIAQAVVLLQESQSITADDLSTANLLNIDRNQRTTVDHFYEDIDNFRSEIFQSHFRMERRTMDALTEYIATKVQTDASIIPLKNKVLLTVWLLANKLHIEKQLTCLA
nr:unnamed protein product [Callosobruchus analis]